MRRAIDETERRRNRQVAFNAANGITPRSVVREIRDLIDGVMSNKSKQREADAVATATATAATDLLELSEKELSREIARLEKQMLEHARNLEFEKAARVREQLAQLREQAFGAAGHDLPTIAGGAGRNAA